MEILVIQLSPLHYKGISEPSFLDTFLILIKACDLKQQSIIDISGSIGVL